MSVACVCQLKRSQELYKEFKKEERRLFAKDPSGLNDALCSSDYFNKVWKQHYPRLKLKPCGDFMLCQTCTLLKEKLHGQAGSRGTQNQAERERCTREYEAHVKVSPQLFVV